MKDRELMAGAPDDTLPADELITTTSEDTPAKDALVSPPASPDAVVYIEPRAGFSKELVTLKAKFAAAGETASNRRENVRRSWDMGETEKNIRNKRSGQKKLEVTKSRWVYHRYGFEWSDAADPKFDQDWIRYWLSACKTRFHGTCADDGGITDPFGVF